MSLVFSAYHAVLAIKDERENALAACDGLRERQQVSESVLLKRLIDSAVHSVGQRDADVLRSPPPTAARLAPMRTSASGRSMAVDRTGGGAADGGSDLRLRPGTRAPADTLATSQGGAHGAEARCMDAHATRASEARSSLAEGRISLESGRPKLMTTPNLWNQDGMQWPIYWRHRARGGLPKASAGSST